MRREIRETGPSRFSILLVTIGLLLEMGRSAGVRLDLGRVTEVCAFTVGQSSRWVKRQRTQIEHNRSAYPSISDMRAELSIFPSVWGNLQAGMGMVTTSGTRRDPDACL